MEGGETMSGDFDGEKWMVNCFLCGLLVQYATARPVALQPRQGECITVLVCAECRAVVGEGRVESRLRKMRRVVEVRFDGRWWKVVRV